MANERRNPVADSVSRTDFSAVSMATPRPLDKEGIPFLTNHEVGSVFGIGMHNSKQASYSSLPQYKERKGTSGRDQNDRTWISVGDLVSHLSTLSGQHLPAEKRTESHKRFEASHAQWSGTLDAARAHLSSRREAGENPGDFFNQPHPSNKNIHTRMEYFPQGRPYTVDDPLAPEGIRGSVNGSSSNLENPRRHGFSEPPTSGAPDMTILDPSRPSRIQRRGRE